MKLTPPTLESARAMRDGGIDAMAALDFALREALAGLPPDRQGDIRRAFGAVMGELIDKLIDPAVQAFPGLAVDEEAWKCIAAGRARERAAR